MRKNKEKKAKAGSKTGRRKRFGLTRQFLLANGVPLTLIFIELIIVLVLVLRAQVEPLADARMRGEALAANTEVATYLDNIAGFAEDYAQDVYLQEFAYQAAETGTYYADMPGAYRIYGHLGAVADMFPEVINEFYFSSGYKLNDLISGDGSTSHEDCPELDMLNAEWMTAMRESGADHTIFTNPYLDETTGLMVCTIGVPVYHNDILLGMLGIDIQMSEVNKIFENATIGETGYAVAVLPDGTIYYHPDRALTGLNIYDIGLPSDVLGNYEAGDGETIVLFKNAEGEEEVCCAAEIGDTGWTMIMFQDEREAYTVVHDITNIMQLLFFVSIILMMILLAVVTRRLIKPVSKVVSEANKLATGDLVTNDCPFVERPKDEMGLLYNAFYNVIKSSREQADALQKLAAGDIDTKVEVRSENDLVNISMNEVITSLNNLISETDTLTDNALAGNTGYRANTDQFQGAYARLVIGFNETIDAIMSAVNLLSESMIQIGNGEMPHIDKNSVRGDYVKAVEALEYTETAITALTAESRALTQAVASGDFSNLSSADKYKGEYREIISNINDTLKAVLAKASWYEEILDSIPMPVQVVDLDQRWTLVNKAFAAPFIQTGMMPNAEAFIGREANVQGMDLNGVDELIHQGISEKMIRGEGGIYRRQTNAITDLEGKSIGYVGTMQDLTAIVGQSDYIAAEINRVEGNLTNLAEGVFTIAQSSQVPDDNTRVVAEQFARIDDSLSQVAKSVEKLAEDTKEMAAAAVAGDLEKRMNQSAHKGEYGEVAASINDTVDAILEPIKETLDVLEYVAGGSLQHQVMGDYQGDHARMKNALNGTINSLKAVIGDISQTLAGLGEGDLTVEVDTAIYHGDFDEIKDSLLTIKEKLLDVMKEMNESADQVASGAKQLADAASALAAGSTKQASAVQQLSATMNQVADQTKKNAADASKASSLSSDVMNMAERGNDQMQEMLKSMEDINESSANISKIIKVIDDIAFQTNILALNAAVEAARAGVHGKGFAVVADEVRNLAAKSAQAASETTALIEGSITKVEAGTKIAKTTAEALGEIVNGITETSRICNAIAEVSASQQEGIEQVDVGVAEISDVIRENSSTAQESAASSEELHGQTDTLKGLVATFKLQ